MKKRWLLLVLYILMLCVSCNNNISDISTQEVGEVYINFNDKRVENGSLINVETGVIYGLEVRFKGNCSSIRLEYDKDYFETRDNMSFSSPNSGSNNRFFVKEKEGATSLKIFVNDTLQNEYHFIVSDNSINYTLIDSSKNKYVSTDQIVKLTSLDEYKEYIDRVDYREKCTFSENYFKENNIYFVYTINEKDCEYRGMTKVFNDERYTYFNICSQMGTMDEVNVDYYLEVYSLKKDDVREESLFFGSYYY